VCTAEGQYILASAMMHHPCPFGPSHASYNNTTRRETHPPRQAAGNDPNAPSWSEQYLQGGVRLSLSVEWQKRNGVGEGILTGIKEAWDLELE
jgi:hypothetical protein